LYSCNNSQVKTIPKTIRTVDDIKTVDSSVVKPYDYRNVVSLDNIPVSEKKQKFIDLLLPEILLVKVELKLKHEKVARLIVGDTTLLSKNDKKFLNNLLKKYKSTTFTDLLCKLNTHPNSIVLAQSAVESGWGTSRFFQEANNVFGVWSFSKNDNRIKAKVDREGKSIYLKKYSSISESIRDYFLTISKGPYADFRVQREKTKDPFVLISYLEKYSELGEAYVTKLNYVIKKNDFVKFDNYRIDPKYIKKHDFDKDLTEENVNPKIMMKKSNEDVSSKETIINNISNINAKKKVTNSQIAVSPDFSSIKNIHKKKIAFFNFMRPHIIAENEKVLLERNFIVEMQIKLNEGHDFSIGETEKLNELLIRYRVNNRDIESKSTYNNLLLHVDVIPVELALSQAALESAWGTSSFAVEVNNYFGQWCFSEGCGVVPKKRPEGQTHEVAVFDNVSLSVRFYLQFLNSHPLFNKLRKSRFDDRIKEEEPNAYDMAGGLSAYSARGNEYIKEVRSMIVSNKSFMGVE
jgi:Bax protein